MTDKERMKLIEKNHAERLKELRKAITELEFDLMYGEICNDKGKISIETILGDCIYRIEDARTFIIVED